MIRKLGFRFRLFRLAGMVGGSVGALGGIGGGVGPLVDTGDTSIPSRVIGVVLSLVPVRVLPMLVVVMIVVLVGVVREEPLILPHLRLTFPWWKVHLLYVGCVGAACPPWCVLLVLRPPGGRKCINAYCFHKLSKSWLA